MYQVSTKFDQAMYMQINSSCSPGHNVDCKHFLESNCLSVTVAALSSHDVSIRKVAYLVLAQYQELLESSRFREKPQVS